MKVYNAEIFSLELNLNGVMISSRIKSMMKQY